MEVIKATERKPWSKKWIFEIDPSKLDIFPLQFANCERLERHDAVYLFDEVGCGKTISAGLMALHYLYKYPGKKVLVITVNALVTTDKFKNDWKKLLFSEQELQERVKVINNHYSNIEKEIGKRDWGLIIIDEAHLFLNQDTKRYAALCRLKAEKVVFLTATPVKDFRHFNMSVYIDIVKSITGKEPDSKWIEQISTQGKAEEDIICQTFSLDTPVTRYFKDTVKALTTEGYRRTKARWQMPDIWPYSAYETRFHELAQQIKAVLSDEPKSRFVVLSGSLVMLMRLGMPLPKRGLTNFKIRLPAGEAIKSSRGKANI